MSSGFGSPKLTLHFGDGFDFMKKHKGEFDVIITDSSDPIGRCQAGFLFLPHSYSVLYFLNLMYRQTSNISAPW